MMVILTFLLSFPCNLIGYVYCILFACSYAVFTIVHCGIFAGLEVGGQMNLTSGVQVAQLALKHRQNKHQRQRIILFAGRYEV
jgi:hypothetical protein